MGWYKKEVFRKDNKGNWKLITSNSEKAPHEFGRWQQSNKLEQKSNLKEKTYLTSEPTKTNLNIKVVQARTYFGKNEKVVRTLITTSNKLPKNF